MTTVDDLRLNGSATTEFPSLDALRAAHGDLLKRHRAATSTRQVTDELLDLVEQFVRQGRATGALLDVEADREIAQTLLDYWDTVLYRASREVDDSTLADFDETRAPMLDDALCPYVGLNSFCESTHQKFFGRERLLGEWIEQLASRRLLIVLGPSGSGKSSLILGGLLPALKAGALPGSAEWRYFPPLVPGSDPLASLARAVRPPGISQNAWNIQTLDRFRTDPGHLRRLVTRFGEGPAVFVIDQLEEMFTLCTDEAVRHAFADNLLGLVRSPDAGHIVIATIRSDFEQYLTCLDDLPADFDKAQVRITPLNPAELREAIERPAESVGLKFEEGVVDELIQDMHNEPAGLPLLQFTLQKLWEQRRRNRVTREAYDRLGGVHQALERSADLLYEGLTPINQEVLKQILLRMVRPDKGLEVTSNRVTRLSLYVNNFAPQWIDEVLDKLIAAQLVRETKGETADDDQVEVAHEALVRNWGRLLDWLAEERDAIRSRLRLTTLAEQWDAQGRPPESLLRGRILEEALEHTGYSPLGDLFLEASQAAQDEEERQRGRAKLVRRLSFGLLLVLIAAVPSWFWYLRANFNDMRVQLVQSEARNQAALLLSRQLAAQAHASLKEGRRDRALLLSVEAIRARDELEARSSLLNALAYTPETAIVTELTAAPKGMAFSPDGQLLGTVDSEGQIELLSTSTYLPSGPAITVTGPGQTTVVATGLRFSEDGSTMAITTDDGQFVGWCVKTQQARLSSGDACPAPGPALGSARKTISPLVTRDAAGLVIWDPDTLAGRRLEVELAGLTDDTSVFALSPDGKVLAEGSASGHLRLWDAKSGQPYMMLTVVDAEADGSRTQEWIQLQLPTQSTPVTSLAFSQDSSRLAWGTADGTVQVSQLRSRGAVQHEFDDSRKPVTSLAFGPEDKLAWGSADANLYVRDASSGSVLPFAQVRSQPEQPNQLSSAAVAFQPNGNDLAFVAPDGNVAMFQTQRQSTIGQGATINLAVDPRGHRLATIDRDGTVRLWDLATNQPTLLRDGTSGAVVSSIAFNPTGGLLATGSEDGKIVFWDVATAQPSDRLPIEQSWGIQQVAFSPDGRILASVGGDGLQLYMLDGREHVRLPLADLLAAAGAQSVAFSPDGALLATGGRDGTIVLWDTATGQRRAPLRPASSGSTSRSTPGSSVGRIVVTSLAFGPDGTILASGAADGGLTLWDMKAGQPLAAPFKLKTSDARPLASLSFSTDGKQLASASADFPLVLWSLDVQSWIRYACAAARRDLFEDEWKQYLGETEFRPTCSENGALPSANTSEAAAEGRR